MKPKAVTEKQIEYLSILAAKLGVTLQNLDAITLGQASGLIDEMKRAATGDPHSRRYLARDWSTFVSM